MAFMEHEITGKVWWFKVETSDGIEYVPGDVVSSRIKGLKERIRPYVQARDIYGVTVIQGYGARLSAGYGYAIAATATPGLYHITKGSTSLLEDNEHTYRVDVNTCECPDFETARAGLCKHRIAVLILEEMKG